MEGEPGIPDPLAVKQGWLAEEKGSGLSKWPSVYYTNIENYLRKLQKTDGLIRRLETEYKEGKSYRYFKCNFVKEIFYHKISDSSKFCILRCRVTPSQSIHSKPYYVWAIIEKDGVRPGGHIHSAFCTCVAGLLGGCNHVVAMLFRIEAAVSTGATKPGCTSLLAKWNVPSGSKTSVINQPICEVTFHKHHYRKGNKATEETISLTNNMFRKFQTDSLSTNMKTIRENLFETVKTLAPDSCFVELLTGVKKNQQTESLKESIPDSIINQAKKFKINTNITKEENINLFTMSLILTDKIINNIEETTRTQSESTEWYKQREGRLTASNFYKICTRVRAIEKNPRETAEKFVSSLLHKKSFETWHKA